MRIASCACRQFNVSSCMDQFLTAHHVDEAGTVPRLLAVQLLSDHTLRYPNPISILKEMIGYFCSPFGSVEGRALLMDMMCASFRYAVCIR